MPNRGRRDPEEERESDAELWRRFTSDIKPLQLPRAAPSPDVPPPPHPPAPPVERRATPRAPSSAQLGSQPAPSLSPGIATGLDQRTLVRLKRGLLRPESRIDLHNMTQGEAHGALLGFLAAAQHAGRRCVLVITGKGYGAGGTVGVLKTNVPRWLNEPPNRERVLAFTFASSRDGGEGALYILLRRLRSGDPTAAAPTRRR